MNKNVNSSRTQLLSVRMPHELVARMKEHAQYSGQTMTQLFAAAVEYYLNNRSPMEDLSEIVDDLEEEPLPRWGAGRAITQRGLHQEGGRGI